MTELMIVIIAIAYLSYFLGVATPFIYHDATTRQWMMIPFFTVLIIGLLVPSQFIKHMETAPDNTLLCFEADMPAIKKMTQLQFYNPNNGESMITVDLQTGKVSHHPSITLDEASKQFWKSLAWSEDNFCQDFCGCQTINDQWTEKP